MTITLKAGASQAQIQRLNRWLQDQGGNPRICVHEGRTVLELTETTGRVDPSLLADLEFVQSVEQATERRNRYRRDTHPQDVVITLEPSGVQIGGGHFCRCSAPPGRFKMPAPTYSGAAHLSPEPLPTIFRVWALPEWKS